LWVTGREQREGGMKLLFVHQHLGALGGAEANLLLTAAELQGRGHVLGLLYQQPTGHQEKDWHLAFSACFPLPEQNPALTAQTVLNDFAPDLVFLHNFSHLEVLEVLTQSRVPLVRMVHDHNLYCLRGYKYNYFTRQVCTRPASGYCVFPCLANVVRDHTGPLPVRWASLSAKRQEIRLNQQCDCLVVFSEFMKQELMRNGFEAQRIEVLTPVFADDTPRPLSSLGERNLVLFAGQIIRGKGVDVLLRALARLKTPFEGVIAGEGSHRRHCERLCARLGLQERVHFRGFLSHEELEPYYREASVFAFSSVWPEPLGLAGLEAMRYGIPVVAFDTGGIRQWLRDGQNGFLVPWMDTTLFAARIEELLRDKELARTLGRRGLELVTSEYAPSHAIDSLERLFLRLQREAQAQAPTRLDSQLPILISTHD
jgi:glycosyltransferase involved in cell wall biosynthesis